MAECSDLEKSTKGSEELFDICCSPCSDEGKTSEAKKFCVDCGLHFCDSCVRFHEKIPALRSHHIVDSTGDQDKVAKLMLPTKRCISHHGKLMDTFCGDHDEVCCATCIAVKHRTCVKVDYILDIAKGIKTSEELIDTKDAITDLIDNMKMEKNKRSVNLSSIEMDKDRILEDLDQYQDEIISKIKELTESSKQSILTKYEKVKKVIAADVYTLDTLISTTNTNLQKLSVLNECELFANVKASKAAVKDGNAVWKEITSSWTYKRLKYTFDENLKDSILRKESFGNIEDEEDIKEYKATLYGHVFVKTNAHSQLHAITSILPLQNGSTLIADNNSMMLKRLDSNYIIEDTIAVDGHPVGLCNIGRGEVAVSLIDVGKIQFVSVDKQLTLTSTVPVDKSCYGIAYNASKDELIACCGECINVYNRTGTLLRTYQKDNNGKQLFSATRQVVFNAVNSVIVVSDGLKGLVAINHQGSCDWSFHDQELRSAWGICLLPNGNSLVSGISSKNVLQIDKKGKKIGVLLGMSEGLNTPYSVAFDAQTSRLIVGCESDDIHVYTLSRI